MSPENILHFKNKKKRLKVQFVVYADFECYLQDFDFENPQSYQNPLLLIFTKVPNTHFQILLNVVIITLCLNYNIIQVQIQQKYIVYIQLIYRIYLKAVESMIPSTIEEQRKCDKSQV